MGFVHYSKCRRVPCKRLADSGKHLGADRQDEYAYSLVMVNNEMISVEDIKTLKKVCISRTGGSGPTKSNALFCSMVKMGSVPLAKLPLDLKRTLKSKATVPLLHAHGLGSF